MDLALSGCAATFADSFTLAQVSGALFALIGLYLLLMLIGVGIDLVVITQALARPLAWDRCVAWVKARPWNWRVAGWVALILMCVQLVVVGVYQTLSVLGWLRGNEPESFSALIQGLFFYGQLGDPGAGSAISRMDLGTGVRSAGAGPGTAAGYGHGVLCRDFTGFLFCRRSFPAGHADHRLSGHYSGCGADIHGAAIGLDPAGPSGSGDDCRAGGRGNLVPGHFVAAPHEAPGRRAGRDPVLGPVRAHPFACAVIFSAVCARDGFGAGLYLHRFPLDADHDARLV